MALNRLSNEISQEQAQRNRLTLILSQILLPQLSNHTNPLPDPPTALKSLVKPSEFDTLGAVSYRQRLLNIAPFERISEQQTIGVGRI